MALIIPGVSTCPICERIVHEIDDIVATSGVVFEPDHRLYPYCDAPLHQACVIDWPDRREFARAYFDAARAEYQSEFRVLLGLTDQWFVGTAGMKRVTMHLADWPIWVSTEGGHWSELLSKRWTEAYHGAMGEAVQRCVNDIAVDLPDSEALQRRWRAVRGG